MGGRAVLLALIELYDGSCHISTGPLRLSVVSLIVVEALTVLVVVRDGAGEA